MTASTLTQVAPPRVSCSSHASIINLMQSEDNSTGIEEFAAEVREGLQAKPRTLPWTYFYDEIGSRLFESICTLPEYYLTRTEDEILVRHADAMVRTLGVEGTKHDQATIIELGSGSAIKTERLIAAGLRCHGRLHYVPIDVSYSALEDSARRLTGRFPTLRVTGYVADYRPGLERIMARSSGPRLIVFLGSSLGNYEPAAASSLISMVARMMRPTDRFLLGTDMSKATALLEAAYDDDQGVTAAFNLNLLRRINRELGADFQVDAFKHRAIFNPTRGRVEMHLVSTREQTVAIPTAGLSVRFAEGETIHTENSHKYTQGQLAELRIQAGFVEDGEWTDPRGWFQLQRWRLRNVSCL